MSPIVRLFAVSVAVFMAFPACAESPLATGSETPIPLVDPLPVSSPAPVTEPVFADDFAPDAPPALVAEPASPVLDPETPISGPAEYYGADYYQSPTRLTSSSRVPPIEGACTVRDMDQTGRDQVLRISAGDTVADRLSMWLGGYGYTLSWEAPHYRAEGALILDKGFDGTLHAIKDALEAHGAKLTIIVYENCAVRVMGAK